MCVYMCVFACVCVCVCVCECACVSVCVSVCTYMHWRSVCTLVSCSNCIMLYSWSIHIVYSIIRLFSFATCIQYLYLLK